MLLLQHNQEGLTRRLTVIGIPHRLINPFVGELIKWEKCSGVDWTIKRLKSLKVDLIRSQTGLPPLTWVRKNSRGEVTGTIGSLFKWASLTGKNFGRVVQAFMAYTFYILPDLTEGQKEKFLSAINPVKQDDGMDIDFTRSIIQTVRRTFRRRKVIGNHQPLVVYQGSPDKKSPRHFGRRSVRQGEEILDELQIFNHPYAPLFYAEFKRLYSPLLSGLGIRQDLDTQLALWDHNPHSPIGKSRYQVRGGEIHFLQEPGGKLRSVASPFRIHQEALRPFGNELYRLVRSLPWDCTFNQEKALPYIQSHLVQGGKVSSVDLSNATDYFPLRLQEIVLKTIFHKSDWDHINLFIKISRGMWKSKLGDLQWTKGQPLGLYPSFASFTLTHGILLLHLAGGKYNHQFFVVGDDVVILENELYNRYIAMLDRMGCPWSTDKSISSNKLSEFAGKIITPTEVIPQLKWRRMSDDNFLDICRLLGHRSRCLLSKRQKIVFDQVSQLVDPIGLNFNPKGLPLELRWSKTHEFCSPEKLVLGSLMGLRSRINHVIGSSATTTFNSDELLAIVETFDKKVRLVLEQTLFSNWSSSCSIGLDGLATIPEALGIGPRLPLREFSSARKTTLERYERILYNRRPR